jgi:2,4-dienoyl-CoA reductase-like NADH-dependent reductase (Old Yellow Enzyme family)
VQIFESARIGKVELSNRLVRSATFEGMCDVSGQPTERYLRFYRMLSRQGLGAIITGFTFTEPGGRSMQPAQAGLEADAKIPRFREVTRAVHENGARIFLQLAHAGRQTTAVAVGGRVWAPSTKSSWYFGGRPCRLSAPQIHDIVHNFAKAAWRAQEAGFDGIQLHAAHGYLIHQFIHPATNDRRDEYGAATTGGISTLFLSEIVRGVRRLCSPGFPILIKVSCGDNWRPSLQLPQFVELIRFLDSIDMAAIEISYGTMDEALNIFRGESLPVEAVLDHNPRFSTRNPLSRLISKAVILPLLGRRFLPFAPMYNLPAACIAKQHCRVPIIVVGGFRSGADIRTAIEGRGIDFVGLCRAVVCEPDFALRLKRDPGYTSRCANCNRCAVMCDSGRPTHCYGRKANHDVLSSWAPCSIPLSTRSITGVAYEN